MLRHLCAGVLFESRPALLVAAHNGKPLAAVLIKLSNVIPAKAGASCGAQSAVIVFLAGFRVKPGMAGFGVF
jgi:hypothetical protein